MDEFYAALDELYRKGDAPGIENHILTRLHELERGKKGKEPELAAVMNELAGFYRGVSRWDEAEAYSRRALEMLEACGLGSTLQYATALLNLAGTYRLMGRPEESLSGFQRAKAMLESLGAEESYAYMSLLNNLSLTLMALGRTQEAIETAEAALRAVRGLERPEHEVATGLTNLAAMYLNAGKRSLAGELIAQALDIYDAMPEENVHHAAALNTLGAIKYAEGAYPAALAAFERSLALTERFFGRNAEYKAALRSMETVRAAMAAAGKGAENESN